jgi:hypothetical protein
VDAYTISIMTAPGTEPDQDGARMLAAARRVLEEAGMPSGEWEPYDPKPSYWSSGPYTVWTGSLDLGGEIAKLEELGSLDLEGHGVLVHADWPDC